METFSTAQLEAGLDGIRRAPADSGRVALIVRRPAEDRRETLAHGMLTAAGGLAGDSWGSRVPAGERPNPNVQLTVMSSRAATVIAGPTERWPLAGDQLFVDLDLSGENLPAGSRLRVGQAVIEVSAEPHRGCGKFSRRFGVDAMKFVNSSAGRELNLRGINARIVTDGSVHVGDPIEKLP